MKMNGTLRRDIFGAQEGYYVVHVDNVETFSTLSAKVLHDGYRKLDPLCINSF